MTTLDAAIVAAFVAYAVSAGFRNRKQASKNLEEYFLAGRTLPGWKAGLSMSATQFSADTPLLVTGILATAGIFGLWQLWIYAVTFLLIGFVLAGAWRRAGVVTDAEFVELRYAGKPAAVLRAIKAVYLGTVVNCVALAWVLFAAAKIAEPFLLWNEWLPAIALQPVVALVESVGVPLTIGGLDDPQVWIKTANNLISLVMVLGITALYSTTGGLRSVAATDVVQIAIMFLGTVAFTAIVIQEVGGLSAMTDRVYQQFAAGGPGGIRPDEILAFTPDHGKDVTVELLTLLGVLWLINSVSDGSGYLAQRSMACRTDRDARVAAVVFTFTRILMTFLLWLPLGIGLLVLFPPDPGLSVDLLQAERETTYVRGMAELLPIGVRGLMVTAMLAALASTVDTHLNWGSSYWTNDIYKRFICLSWRGKEPSGRELVWVARASNILILIVALSIMTQLTSINQAWQINLLFGAGLGIVLVLRWIWWRMNAWGEIAAMLMSSATAPLLMLLLDDSQQALRLLLAATSATTAALVAVWLKGPEDRKWLSSFYERVRPPGFWGPVSRASGDDGGPRRLGRALCAMFLCALSVFSLLVGLGAWLLSSPAPFWAPSASVWQGGLVVLGLILCPLWYRLGRLSERSTPKSSW
ncbi:MAG: sodium:solute symporter family protein [Acidobacteriota bacterium]|nr:sodium:solute symporter family protein [Acidobacteriota bacterium]